MHYSFGILNALIVAGYLLVTFAIGLIAGRGVKSAAEFQLGGGDLPWWALGISVIATYVSALSFLGAPAWAYGDGMAALAIHINYPIVVFIVVTIFIPFFYNSGSSSIYEYLERRFGVRTRCTVSVIYLVSQTITSASVVTATALVATFVTGVDVRVSVVALTLIVLVYTMVGGIKAVIWTDVMQAAVLFIGAGVVLFSLLRTEAPLSHALHTLAAAGKLNAIRTELDFSVAPTIWAGVIAMSLYHTTVYGANQTMVQRALAARTIGDAKKSYLIIGYAGFVIYFVFFFIGALLYVHFKGAPFSQPNNIILVYAQALAIPGLMGVLVAAILSASMSSLSASFNSLATITLTDFYQRFGRRDASDAHYLWASRAFTVVWALVSIPIALAFVGSGGSILERLSEVASFFVGAQLATFGLGFFSKHTSERGLLIGIAAGFATLFIAVFGIAPLGLSPLRLAWPWYALVGGGVNIVVTLLASLILDGSKPQWHEQSVPGQRQRALQSGVSEMENGWFLTPGRVDRASWGLLVFFLLSLVFLSLFYKFGAQ